MMVAWLFRSASVRRLVGVRSIVLLAKWCDGIWEREKAIPGILFTFCRLWGSVGPTIY